MAQTGAVPYTVRYSSRRTLAICVLPGGEVEVRAPRRCPTGEIERFVGEKQAWISRKQEEARRRARETAALRPSPGGTLPLEGREYPVVQGDGFHFDGERFSFPPEGWPAARPALIAFYRKRAEEILRARLGRYAERIGVSPASVRLSRAERRWGSCSGKGRLNFSWMLAAADERAADYVIVHELCHLREHNHSAAFWRLVEGALPDYRARRARLRLAERRIAALLD